MSKQKRTVTISFDCDTEEGYQQVANMVWHLMRFSPHEFTISHDSTANPQALNDHWDKLGSDVRWA